MCHSVLSVRSGGSLQVDDRFFPLLFLQSGNFYETIGFDALLLCQFANVNPMAPRNMVARAGVPLINMPRAVRALNASNIPVVRTLKSWNVALDLYGNP